MKLKTNKPSNPRSAIYIGGNPLQPDPNDWISYGQTGDVLEVVKTDGINGGESYMFKPHGHEGVGMISPEEIHYI